MCQICKWDEAFIPAIIHALDKLLQDIWSTSLDHHKQMKV
jgi:hypothetical protein